MPLFSNRVERESLRPGDHIYTWRACYIYGHHGIYVGRNTVIHFTVGGREPGTGTPLDHFIARSRSISSCAHLSRPTLHVPGGDNSHGRVESICLDCFLKGGKLYLYEYSVGVAYFLAKFRGGTCTRASADADDVVVRRAKDLLRIGFGSYSLFRKNCENFAVYCKTGLMVKASCMMGQSGQVVSAMATPLAAINPHSLQGLLTTFGTSEWEFLVPLIPARERLLFLPMINIY